VKDLLLLNVRKDKTMEQKMSKKPRRKHSSAFKAKVALAALAGDKTLAQLTQEFEVHQNQIVDWKKQLNERATEVFGKPTESASPPVDLQALHAKIGQLTRENDFLLVPCG
jgi:transposase-like protein